jgi:transposase
MATRKDFSMSVSDRRMRRFSDSFKLEKVREIETGRSTVTEIHTQYEVSYTNIYKWINKFGLMKKKKERIIIETDSDTAQLLALKKKIADLERIVGQKQILLDFKDKMIELAEETYHVDIKKKFSSAPSTSSGSTENNTPLV